MKHQIIYAEILEVMGEEYMHTEYSFVRVTYLSGRVRIYRQFKKSLPKTVRNFIQNADLSTFKHHVTAGGADHLYWTYFNCPF